MSIALLSAGCMLVTDVLGTIMVLAESKERGWLAGFMDGLGWYASIATTSISVSTLTGHNTMQKVWVLLFVGGANVIGTKLGVMSGKWLLGRFPTENTAVTQSIEDPLTVRAVRR